MQRLGVDGSSVSCPELRKAITIACEACSGELSVTELARHSGLSPSTVEAYADSLANDPVAARIFKDLSQLMNFAKARGSLMTGEVIPLKLIELMSPRFLRRNGQETTLVVANLSGDKVAVSIEGVKGGSKDLASARSIEVRWIQKGTRLILDSYDAVWLETAGAAGS